MQAKKEGSIGELLEKALRKLNQMDHYDEYLQRLNSEWYYTPNDLILAHDDEKVWAELKFPGRLKIELAKLLEESQAVESDDEFYHTNPLAKEASSRDIVSEEVDEEESPYDAPVVDNNELEYNSWVKCWAPEHECYYFYNTHSQESSWEDPYGADETAVYDVYQYNEETQEWIVIEDNTSAYQGYDAEGNYLHGDTPSEEKEPTSRTESKEHDSFATFTRPRDPHSSGMSVDHPDALFALSPNRPGAKNVHPSPHRHYDESKANYKFSLRGGKSIPSPGRSPVPVRRVPKPIRLAVSNLSDDSGSDNTPTTTPKKLDSLFKEGSAKKGPKDKHSPLDSKPSGYNSTSGRSNYESKLTPTNQFSTKGTSKGALMANAASKESPMLYREDSGSMDSETEYPTRHANGAYANGAYAGAYANTNLTTKPTTSNTTDDALYTSEHNQPGDEHYTQAENDAYYSNFYSTSEKYEPHPSSDSYDPDLQFSSSTSHSKHKKLQYKSEFTHYQEMPDFSSQKTEERVLEESYYHHTSEPSAPREPTTDSTYRNPFSTKTVKSQDSPHIIGLPAFVPVVAPNLYTPNGRNRKYSQDEKETISDSTVTYATPVPDNDPTGENYFMLDSPAVSPIGRVGANNVQLMEIAMGTPSSPALDGSDTNKPSSRSAGLQKKPKSALGKLLHMNPFKQKGPSVPVTPPPPRDNSRDNDRTSVNNPHSSAYRTARQAERREARKSTTSNPSNDIVITNNAVPVATKMRPFPSTSPPMHYEADHSANNNSNRSTTNTNNANNTKNNAEYYNAASVGEKHDLGRRRKPAPAAADSAASTASQEQFYAQHGTEKQYKYHPNNPEHSARVQKSRGKGSTSSNDELQHLQNLQVLMDMGFGESESIMALNMCSNDLTEATQMLFESRG
uniref:UBA domain-containing protein n=1 Tax=Spumella elongata TaxID=89044 RepID=A0A7S3GTA6_9STRA|mmetsp:Transcript_18671/g.32379  ORF Transcript_18671/g.32379 Transcript_18671/m.32379 type:complete len:905 (+) Transcript_18671:85-2799(+)